MASEERQGQVTLPSQPVIPVSHQPVSISVSHQTVQHTSEPQPVSKSVSHQPVSIPVSHQPVSKSVRPSASAYSEHQASQHTSEHQPVSHTVSHTAMSTLGLLKIKGDGQRKYKKMQRQQLRKIKKENAALKKTIKIRDQKFKEFFFQKTKMKGNRKTNPQKG